MTNMLPFEAGLAKSCNTQPSPPKTRLQLAFESKMLDNLDNMKINFSGSVEVDTRYYEGMSALRLREHGRQLLYLLAERQVPVPDFLKAHKKTVDMTKEHVSESWAGETSLGDLVFNSPMHSKAAKQNIARAALALLEANQIAVPNDLLNMRLEPMRLMDMPNEMISRIAHYAVRQVGDGDHPQDADVDGEIDIASISTWNTLLLPLSACKDLREAGKDQIFDANTGFSHFKVIGVHHQRRGNETGWGGLGYSFYHAYQPNQRLVGPMNAAAGLCKNLLHLDVTLPFGDFRVSNTLEFDVQMHTEMAQASSSVLATLHETCPKLKSLRVWLQTCTDNNFNIAKHTEWESEGTSRAIISNIYDVVEQLSDLKIPYVGLRLRDAGTHANWSKPERYIEDGPWDHVCKCETPREGCRLYATQEWATSKDPWALRFGTPPASTRNIGGTIVDVEDEMDEAVVMKAET